MTISREDYWSWDNRHLRLDVNRYGINGLLFIDMTTEQLKESCTILTKLIEGYKQSISGISIPDQERHAMHWNALINADRWLQYKKNLKGN